MRTIRIHDSGAAVEDVQRRLRLLGYELALDGQFLERTQEAVRAFRAREGLPEGGDVDEDVWHALVDASFALGDRMLYLRMPHFHGRDVLDLQSILEVLGFAVGDNDGIFGAHTEHALREFQTNVGLDGDGIAGNTTFDAITRLRHAWEGKQAASSGTDEYTGFARAAEALRRMEACFYGLDPFGRDVARRIANLARATTPDARVASADALGGTPPDTMLMVGISTESRPLDERVPIVVYSEDRGFPQRLRTAMSSAGTKLGRIVVDVSAAAGGGAEGEAERERLGQHAAVMMLDAFCMAFG